MRGVKQIGAPMAKLLHGVIATYDTATGTITLPPATWRNEPRVEMWNTRTRKKMSTRSCPKAADADAWLAARPHCERYTGQDVQQKGPNRVPDANVMTEATFVAHCENPTSAEESGRIENTSARGPIWPSLAPRAAPC